MDDVPVPDSFRRMPRWWRDGSGWLDGLPGLVRAWCSRWDLEVAGAPAHGSNALVVPVRRGGSEFVLRVTPPDDDVAGQVAALRFWDGRGTVQLVDADVAAGVMLLERLSMAGSLLTVPSPEAMAVLGAMMRRLAVPAPAGTVSTDTVVADRLAAMEPEWRHLGRPFDEAVLRRALDAGARVGPSPGTDAVNGDLHSAQVLRGTREPWLAVDPVLMRGDPAYDLARVLWTRSDDMRDDRDIRDHLAIAASAAAIDADRARDWVVYRTVDYWLWGLTVGLTEDPERCRRLIKAVQDP